jgi:bifunctional UDP-N-acetylglucosamine pyrophosphorylase/glucosamine-1-phosphate N-acetyltransferase
VVEGTSIENATVGPFARTREKTHVSNGAKIGNFVEVKNSEIGKKVKVNHLSYIGDTAIDNDTNIGAGTITCNYDGVEKHKTKIGKNVFVGSNTSLIAPLQIHDNAVIGAGSVIVKDVEKGDLAIARNVQKNIENWHARNVRKKSLEDCKKD